MVVHRTWDDIAGQEAKMPPQSWGNDGDNVAGEILRTEALPSTLFPAVATEVEERRGFYNDIDDCLRDPG